MQTIATPQTAKSRRLKRKMRNMQIIGNLEMAEPKKGKKHIERIDYLNGEPNIAYGNLIIGQTRSFVHWMVDNGYCYLGHNHKEAIRHKEGDLQL